GRRHAMALGHRAGRLPGNSPALDLLVDLAGDRWRPRARPSRSMAGHVLRPDHPRSAGRGTVPERRMEDSSGLTRRVRSSRGNSHLRQCRPAITDEAEESVEIRGLEDGLDRGRKLAEAKLAARSVDPPLEQDELAQERAG